MPILSSFSRALYCAYIDPFDQMYYQSAVNCSFRAVNLVEGNFFIWEVFGDIYKQSFFWKKIFGWLKIRQYVLESLKVIDIHRLKEAEKDELLNVFEEISDKKFSCIWKQILRNVSTTYNNPFEPRIKMDMAILNIIFPRKKRQDIEDILNQVYLYLIDEIIVVWQLVSN